MTLRTVERAINVLYHVCESDNPMSLTEVSKALELGEAHRIVISSALD